MRISKDCLCRAYHKKRVDCHHLYFSRDSTQTGSGVGKLFSGKQGRLPHGLKEAIGGLIRRGASYKID